MTIRRKVIPLQDNQRRDQMDLKLGGKKVLITGASQGLGEGLASAFAAEGCHLHLTARSEEKLDALKRRLGS